MGKNFSFYEQTGILIPGATLVFGLLFFFPEFRMLFFSDGVSIGGLGLFFPGLIKSESLHYGYAVVMLIGLWTLRSGFTGKVDRFWWMTAFWIQFFHHIEHALLQAQVIVGHNLMGRPVPTSLVQLWVPRVELHLFYNTIVFIPMVIAMYYHLFPPAAEKTRPQCSCAFEAA